MTDDVWKPWPKCPADGCEETEGVTIMECAPGYTYMTVGDVCHHWTTLVFPLETPQKVRDQMIEYFRPTDVPRETMEHHHDQRKDRRSRHRRPRNDR